MKEIALIVSLMIVLPTATAKAQSEPPAWLRDLESAEKAVSEGRRAQAEQIFLAAIKTTEQLKPSDPGIPLTRSHLAWFYCSERDFPKAEPLLTSSIPSLEKLSSAPRAAGLFIPEHLAKDQVQLGQIYLSDGRGAQAEPLLKSAIRISEKLIKDQHDPSNTPRNNAEWMRWLGSALANMWLDPGREATLADACEELGRLYSLQGKTAEAGRLSLKAEQLSEDRLRRLVASSEPASVVAPLPLANALNMLAVFYYKHGRYQEAETLFGRALSIYEKKLGPDRPEVALCLENYSVLLNKVGRQDLAKSMSERARAIRAALKHQD